MDTAEIEKLLAEVSKSANAARILLREIDRLDADRAANLVRLQQRLSRLQATATVLQRASTVSPALEEWQTAHQDNLRAFREEQLRHFATGLQRELQAVGRDLGGHLPELRSGIYTLAIDPDGWQVTLWLGPKQENLGTCPVSPGDVARRIAQCEKDAGSHLDEAAFVRRVQDALQRLQPAADGEGYVPIIALLGELALLLQNSAFRKDPRRETFHSYGRADLSSDLHRFRRRVQLRIATRALARSREHFLWVPSDERTGDGSIYSHIRLERKTP